MIHLSTQAFDNAAGFISENARPVDRAQFNFHFGDGSKDQVIDELAKYQNADGGFGHAIEPDIRMPSSSPFLGTLAFQVLRELEVPGDALIVKRGLGYFEQTFDRSIGGWDPNGPEVDKYPHAVWWNYSPVADRLDPLVQANPGAEIVGYLNLYREHVDETFLEEATAAVVGAFEALPVDMEFHALMCFIRMAEMADEEIRRNLLPKIRESALMAIGNGKIDWSSYGARALAFAPSSTGLLAAVLVDRVHQQIDFEIGDQSNDGSWQPTFSWGQYEDDWPTAKTEWAGYLTLRNLLAFKSWDRI